MINLDIVPRNLDEAIDIIFFSLSKEEKDYIKKNGPECVHFTTGMWIRNNWSLWDKDTHLVQWFRDNLKISHADDISSIIIDAVWHKVKDEKFDIDKRVAEVHEHWRKNKFNNFGESEIKVEEVKPKKSFWKIFFNILFIIHLLLIILTAIFCPRWCALFGGSLPIHMFIKNWSQSK